MDYLPLFADLSGRPVLVVGGGDIAARKIELLRRARARVLIASRELCPELQALLDKQALEWLATEFDPAQLDGVFLVIAATDDNHLALRMRTRIHPELGTGRPDEVVAALSDEAAAALAIEGIVRRRLLLAEELED